GSSRFADACPDCCLCPSPCPVRARQRRGRRRASDSRWRHRRGDSSSWLIVRSGFCPGKSSSDNNRMSEAVKTAQMACTSGPLPRVDADVVIVPWFESTPASDVPGLDDAIGGEVQRAAPAPALEGAVFHLLLYTA